MVKKFMLVGLFVLTVGLLPLNAELSGSSTVFAAGGHRGFASPLPTLTPMPLPTVVAPVPPPNGGGTKNCKIVRIGRNWVRICRIRGHR